MSRNYDFLSDVTSQFNSNNGVIVSRKPYGVNVSYMTHDNHGNPLKRKFTIYGNSERECYKNLNMALRGYLNDKNVDVSDVSYITDVDFSNSDCTSIGKDAFRDQCITSINLGSKISIISRNAFSNNKLKLVKLPYSLGVIGENAFSDNDISDVVIPSSVTSIWDGAFSGNDIDSIYFLENHSYDHLAKKPLGLTYIGPNAFDGYTADEISIPNSVSIYTDAFPKKTKVLRKTR